MTLTYKPFAKSEPRPVDDAISRIMSAMRRDMLRRCQEADSIAARIAKADRFAEGAAKAFREDMRNPSTGGGTSHEARFKGAAGHDSRNKYKVSGPATLFGQPGRSTKVSSR